jgi:hypothetical protein
MIKTVSFIVNSALGSYYLPHPPHGKGCYVKENSPLKGQLTRLKNQATGQAKIGSVSINNSQVKYYFYFMFWL